MSCNFRSFLIVGAALMVVIVTAKEPLCGINEQWGNCGPICEEKCDNPDLSECAATSCAGSGCQCKPGYRRNNETNLCVLPSECPTKKCKKNEILAPCGAQCEGDCQNPRRPYICMLIKCSIQGCLCDLSKGYVRNAQGKCVRNQDDKSCAAQLVCPANSEPMLCGGRCESTCARPEKIYCKFDPTNCTIDCQCKDGFVRNELTRQCIKQSQCYREVSDKSDSKDSNSQDSDSDNSNSKDSKSQNSDSHNSNSKGSDSHNSHSKDSNSQDSDSKNSDSTESDEST